MTSDCFKIDLDVCHKCSEKRLVVLKYPKKPAIYYCCENVSNLSCSVLAVVQDKKTSFHARPATCSHVAEHLMSVAD